MNKLMITLLAFTCLIITSKTKAQELKYRRSSLQMMLIESDNFPNKEKVVKAYTNHPFPDKYNKHSIGKESFDVTITDKDLLKAGFLKDTLKKLLDIAKATGSLKPLKYLNTENTKAVVLPTEREQYKIKIDKFINESQLAKQLVAKWFNRQSNGKIDYELIKERGMYSASAEDKALAQKSADTGDYLFDLDLIGNTFVVFNRLNFFNNEPPAKIVLAAALAKAAEIKIPMAQQKAIEGAQKVYEKAKEGYTVFATSFLYKLDWNNETANKFKSYFQNDKINSIAAWDTTKLFKLSFVGDEKSFSIVTFSLGAKRTEEQIITLAVDRNLDNVFAKLQKEYEVFRPVTPISSVGPVTAKIGLKEGIEPGQSFEILESRKDVKTGLYKYESIGSVKVDKKLPIWDNRIGAAEEPELDKDGKPIVTPEFTNFGESSKAQAGMHFLRLKK